MQNQGTYIEQFMELEKVSFAEIDVAGTKETTLAIALIQDWFMDDKIDGQKHSTTRIRFDWDNKLLFMSDAKALLLATSIIKHLAKQTDEDVIGAVKQLLSDVEDEK